jgi:hypothetical protein
VHSWSIGIENARDFYLEFVLAVIIEEEGLCTTFPLIVARPKSDRIYVSPVVLRLWMDDGIAINLTCGGLKDSASEALCEA